MKRTNVASVLLGRPLATHHAHHERLDSFRALAVFASDPISSNAYATEAILVVLATLGTASLHLALPLSIMVALLVAIVILSYNETIRHYPRGGGAYIVARDNLGQNPALIAAAALLTDYVLTVAVSVAAGVRAISSATGPDSVVAHHHIWVGVVIIVLIAWANLRGTKESATLFAVPTYAFVVGVMLVLVIGLLRYFGIMGSPLEPNPLPMETRSVVGLAYAFVLLRAFAAGCTALTGIEAISDGVAAFRPPAAENAIFTMRVMGLMAMSIFLGIGFLATRLHLTPVESQSLLSQLTREITGGGLLYYWVQLFTMLILVLAANTAFQDFPRLASILAGDRFVPGWLRNVGRRLVFSSGIVLLSALSAILLVAFKGEELNLLPLYAIGVFISFTLSQAGMVRLCNRVGRLKPGEEQDIGGTTLHYEEGWRLRQARSAIGATVTAIVFVVLAVTKFREGAWMVLIAIPIVAMFFKRVRRHYDTMAANLRIGNLRPSELRTVADVAIVPIADVHRGTLRAIRYATRLSGDVRAVHVATDPNTVDELRERWAAWESVTEPARLIVVPSPYRDTIGPLVDYVEEVREEFPGQLVTVVVPNFVTETVMDNALHNQTATLLQLRLQAREDVVIIRVPYHVHAEPNDEADGGDGGGDDGGDGGGDDGGDGGGDGGGDDEAAPSEPAGGVV